MVRVTEDSDAATRLQKRRGTASTEPGMLELHYTDLAILADELASAGPEVLVISPGELRHAVRSRLITTAEAHSRPAEAPHA